MLTECLENEEYAAAFKTKRPRGSVESLFIVLIQQQKMIRLLYEIIYIVSNNGQTMNTKLFLTAIAIVATFSIAVTAITTNVSAQNMTEGNMTEGNMTGVGQISGEAGGPEGTDISGGCRAACHD
jgi:hypothetical protein